MKILILPSWYPKGKDISGIFIQNQAQILSKTEGLDVRVVDCSFRRQFVPRHFQMIIRKRKVAKALKNFQPDVVHAHVAYPAGVIALSLREKTRAKLLLTEHCGPLDLLAPYFDTEEDFNSVYSKFDQVIAVSTALKNQILKRAPKAKIEVVGNSIDEEFLKTSLKTLPEKFTMAVVARLDEAKGIPELLQTLKHLDEKLQTKVVLNVVGEGELKTSIGGFKNIEVKHHGFCSHDDVREILNGSSVLVLPSRHETFSMIAAEALALGRKVVGFKCGGPEDFVSGINGTLLDRDPVKLADLLFECMSNKDSQLVERRSAIEGRYSGKVIAEKLKSIYQGMFS